MIGCAACLQYSQCSGGTSRKIRDMRTSLTTQEFKTNLGSTDPLSKQEQRQTVLAQHTQNPGLNLTRCMHQHAWDLSRQAIRK